MHRVIVVGLGEAMGALLAEIAQTYESDPLSLHGQGADTSLPPLRLWFVPNEPDQAQRAAAGHPSVHTLALQPHDLEVLYYQHEQVRHWCGPNWRHWSLEALRANRLYGKLAVYYHLDRIVQVLSAQIAQIERAPHERLYIYITAMLGDAFATGALIDIAYVLNQLALQRNGRVFGLLFLPPSIEATATALEHQQHEWAQAICYATLRELHFYSGPSMFYTNQHRTHPIPTAQDVYASVQASTEVEAGLFLESSPFQTGDCYLLGGAQDEYTNPISFAQALNTAAQWVYLQSVPFVSDKLTPSEMQKGSITTFGLQIAADEYIGLDDVVVQRTALHSLSTLVKTQATADPIIISLQDLVQFEPLDAAKRQLQGVLQNLPDERILPTGRGSPAERLEGIDKAYQEGVNELQTFIEPRLSSQVENLLAAQTAQLDNRFRQTENIANSVSQLDDAHRHTLSQLEAAYEEARQQRQTVEVEAAALVSSLSDTRDASLYWLEGQSRTRSQIVGQVLVGTLLLFLLTGVLAGGLLLLGLPFPLLGIGAFLLLGLIVLFDSLTPLSLLSLLFVGSTGVLFASNSFIVQALIWLVGSIAVYRLINRRLESQRQSAYRTYLHTQREALERQFSLLVAQSKALYINGLFQHAQQRLGQHRTGPYQRYSLRIINATETLLSQYSLNVTPGQPTLSVDSLAPIYRALVNTWQAVDANPVQDSENLLAQVMQAVKRSHILNQDVYDAALLEKAVLHLQKEAPHLLALNRAYLPEQNRYTSQQFVVTKGWKEQLVVDEMHTFFQQQQMTVISLSSAEQQDEDLKRRIVVVRTHPSIPLRALLNLPLWRSVYLRWCESWRNQEWHRHHSFFHPMRVTIAGPDILLDPPSALDEHPTLIWVYTFLMQWWTPLGFHEGLCRQYHITMHPRINYDELCGALQEDTAFIQRLLTQMAQVETTRLSVALHKELSDWAFSSFPRLSEEYADWQVWTAHSLRQHLHQNKDTPQDDWVLRLYCVLHEQSSKGRATPMEKDQL